MNIRLCSDCRVSILQRHGNSTRCVKCQATRAKQNAALRQRMYRQRPENKAYQLAYRQRPENKAYQRAYKQRPEYKAYQRAYLRRLEPETRRCPACGGIVVTDNRYTYCTDCAVEFVPEGMKQ